MKKKPNLLFVLVDQMRYSAMGCAGNDHVHTPNLDRMASDGACLTNAVSNCPVCTPARACMLTGMYPLSNTVLTNNSMLPNDMPSIGKWLKADGYDTGYIGKWHLAGEAFIGKTEQNNYTNGWIPPGPMRHGFDYWAVHHCSHGYWNAVYFRDTPDPIPIEGWEPDGQTDLAVDYVKNHSDSDGEHPFALFVSWGPPHTPFTAPPEFLDMYDPDRLKLRPNVVFDNLLLKPDDKCTHHDPEAALRHYTHNYYAAISSLDHNLGRLLKTLDAEGIGDETIVVFTSDHGDMLGSHGHLHKLQPWDESALIPFLVRYPRKVNPGIRPDLPFNLPDIVPTLFGMMDLPVPGEVEGVDCTRAFRGEDMPEQNSSFLVWPCSAVTWGKKWSGLEDHPRGFPHGFMRPYRGIRTRTHTYVIDRNGPWFLYDNSNDPYQMSNLVEQGERQSVPPELENELNEWLERTGDNFEDTEFYKRNIDLETGLVIDPKGFRR